MCLLFPLVKHGLNQLIQRKDWLILPGDCPSPREVSSGTQSTSWRSSSNVDYLLICSLWLAEPALSYNPGPPACLGWIHPQWFEPIHTSNSSIKYPGGMSTGQSAGDIFTIEVPSFQATPVRAKVAKRKEHTCTSLRRTCVSMIKSELLGLGLVL